MPDYKEGPSSGLGGNTYEALPPLDEDGVTWHIREIKVRSGNRIDQLQVEWENSDSDVDFLDSARFGGDGGSQNDFDIASNDFLTTIQGTLGEKNGSVRVFSLQFITLNNNSSEIFGRPGPVSFSYEAPPGFHIIGIHGKEGNEIDGIGVFLRPIPS